MNKGSILLCIFTSIKCILSTQHTKIVSFSEFKEASKPLSQNDHTINPFFQLSDEQTYISSPHIQSSLVPAESLETLNDFAHRHTLSHLGCHLNSFPLTQNQINAYNSSFNTLSNILNAMIYWQYQDIMQICNLYNEFYNPEQNDSSFTHWISTIFDLRIVELPKIDFSNMEVTIWEETKKKLQTILPLHMQNEQIYELIEKYFKINNQIEFESQSIHYDSNLKAQLQDARNELGQYVQNAAFAPQEINFSKNLLDSNIICAELAGQFHMCIFKAKDLLMQAHKYLQRLYSAQRILKAWNARNFKLIGSDPNKYVHPIYGKIDHISERFKNWDKNFRTNIFPAEEFEYQTETNTSYYGKRFKGLSDMSPQLTERFCYEPNKYTLDYEDFFYNQVDPLEVNVINNNQTSLVEGNASQVLDTIRSKTNYQSKPLYQTTYQVLLALAFTDNKFAQDLLSTPYPIYTDGKLEQGEEKYNVYGLLLAHIRSLLLYAISDQQFLEFVVSYFSDYDSMGHYNSTNHIRINTNVTYQPQYSFETQLNSKTYRGCQTAWIEPFKTPDCDMFFNEFFHSNNLWKINLQNTQTFNLPYIPKHLKYNEHINIIESPIILPDAYFPALSRKLLEQLQLHYGLKNTLTDSQIAHVDAYYQANQPERERASELIELYNALIKQSEHKLCLQKQLALCVLPKEWLNSHTILKDHPNYRNDYMEQEPGYFD